MGEAQWARIRRARYLLLGSSRELVLPGQLGWKARKHGPPDGSRGLAKRHVVLASGLEGAKVKQRQIRSLERRPAPSVATKVVHQTIT